VTRRYTLRPRALSDLEGIWDYTAESWGAAQAELYVRQLSSTMASLAERPLMVRACPELREGYYRHRSGAHVLFYRLTEDGIDVVRILHQRMDYDGAL
jgi:toxin ParE1/3/4